MRTEYLYNFKDGGSTVKHAGYVVVKILSVTRFPRRRKSSKSPDQVLGDLVKWKRKFRMLTRTSVIVMTDLFH